MKSSIALALAGLLLAAPGAQATEWVACADASGAASFDYLAGDGVDVLAVSKITLSAGEKVWASDPANGPGDPVQVGQAFEDAETVRIDAVDASYAKVAELRLFKAVEADSALIYAGTLRIIGVGAWAVSCQG